ncbi:hypothetical protein V8J36_12450 [Frigidibacter sp. MR17.14]|uniref:EF-hand domain-containing protein n=1 Tax=Frigidibacter sp. MR17.14 TaxID=3126509 RepID=UPI0030131304
MTGRKLSSRARILGGALVVALGAGALAVPALADRGPGSAALGEAGPGWRQQAGGHGGDHGGGHDGRRGGMMAMLPDFAELDADGDGSVTPEELAAWRQDRIAVDSDGDGRISADELVAHDMEQAEARIRARVARQMAAQDVDGDGFLDVDELLARPMPMMDRMFDRIDGDDDGALSAEEFQSARDRMAEMREGRRGRGQDGWHHGMGHGAGWGGMPMQRMMPPPAGAPAPGDAPAAAPSDAPEAAPVPAPVPAPGSN